MCGVKLSQQPKMRGIKHIVVDQLEEVGKCPAGRTQQTGGKMRGIKHIVVDQLKELGSENLVAILQNYSILSPEERLFVLSELEDQALLTRVASVATRRALERIRGSGTEPIAGAWEAVDIADSVVSGMTSFDEALSDIINIEEDLDLFISKLRIKDEYYFCISSEIHLLRGLGHAWNVQPWLALQACWHAAGHHECAYDCGDLGKMPAGMLREQKRQIEDAIEILCQKK